ncbi:MAG: uracil-DNA glycosylase [Thermoplasmata archaeon]
MTEGSTGRAAARIPRARAEAWAALTEEIRHCEKCPLHASRTQAVVYRGGPSPRVLFVGEAPGVQEDRVGIPFVGRSGRWLDAAVARLGLEPEEVGVLNLLKCRPPGNRFDRSAARSCRPYLDRQIALLEPRCLVTIGATAYRALSPGGPPILAAAGRPRPDASPPLFPLIHPAAAMRSRRLSERWARDVDALDRWITGGVAQPV